ncbi:hypothetical protein EDB92DRAFT_1938779 [Lactarius akahatsu]|uniref:EF-hand domain-containing protein n=1 Tax=Lactarius akahatsu TaxID=416441 RepID=A0AAD4LSG2_9AGAM|nr:hypothetical protein EDB92DRAFT_1938779 [Lactarius akahatsu]
MPPSTLQARIKAFEALGMGASKQVLDTVTIHSEPEHLLDSPLSPTVPSIPPIVPTVYTPSASPSSLRHRSSLVDLKDWVIDDGPLRASSPTAVLNGYSPPKPFEDAPLISFESSPPKLSKAPPLPPRQPSYNSLRSVSAPATSPTIMSTSPSVNMLMPPDADHSYPPTLSNDKLSMPIRRGNGHAPASSVSSFHSVSLSSDGGDPTAVGVGYLHAFSMEREWTGASTEDGESLDESFENVSAPSSFLPPITLPPRPPKPPGNPTVTVPSKPPPPPLPPKLPQRQQRGSTASSLASRGSSPSSTTSPALALTPSGSSSTPSLASTRRVPPPLPITTPPPPPPPRSRPPSARTSVQSTATTASDRSSLFSTTSRTSISSRTSVSPSKTSKPAPKPSPRARYDALFLANVRAHAPRKPPPPPIPAKRQNAGWRGLSIDLDQSAHPAPAVEPGPDARMDGRLVRKIWLKSGLEPQRLRDIWNECDPEGLGSIDRDAFAQGMTRIDEELRRAQVLGRAGAGSGANGRTPRRAPSRPILR